MGFSFYAHWVGNLRASFPFWLGWAIPLSICLYLSGGPYFHLLSEASPPHELSSAPLIWVGKNSIYLILESSSASKEGSWNHV